MHIKHPSSQGASYSPETAEQRWITILETVLDTDDILPDDRLLDLGVDSLSLLEVADLAAAQGVSFVGLDRLRENPTVRELFEQPEATDSTSVLEDDQPFPLLPTQADILSIPNSGSFTTNPKAYCLPRDLSNQQIKDAVNDILIAHPSLRTRILSNGQQITVPASDLEPCIFGYGSDATEEMSFAKEMDELWRELSVFDLQRDLPFRVCLITRRGEAEPVLLVATHHLASDGRSEAILHSDLVARLHGRKIEQGGFHVSSWAREVSRMVSHDPEKACDQRFWLDYCDQKGWMPDRLVEEWASARLRNQLNDTCPGVIRQSITLSTTSLPELVAAATCELSSQTPHVGFWVQLTDSGRLGGAGRLGRAVGCLYYNYPVWVEPSSKLDQTIQRIDVAISQIPKRGFGYAALRWLSPDDSVRRTLAKAQPLLTVNVRHTSPPVQGGIRQIVRPDLVWNFDTGTLARQIEIPMRLFVDVHCDSIDAYVLGHPAFTTQSWVASFANGVSQRLGRSTPPADWKLID